MSEFRNMEIKLFGKTITSQFHVNHCDPSSFSSVRCDVSDQRKEALSSSSSSSCSPSLGPDKIPSIKRIKDPYILSDLNESPKAVSEISNYDQQSEITTTTTSTTSVDKTTTTILKKPDKILPCPRCESADTKFCYYNNYNVNQPRYFCRNCQRYWTSGGSMRSVPVGSGRRKNKGWASSNNYLQVTSEDYENNNSGKILSFGFTESSITETLKHQSGDAKITTKSEEHKNGFLHPQVILPNHPWPYQWSPMSPNSNLYPIPIYWGCKVPLWPASPCLGKRSREQASVESERKVWSKSQTNPEKKPEGFSLFDGFETKDINRRSLVPETSVSLQANPAAMSRSMNFRESMQQ